MSNGLSTSEIHPCHLGVIFALGIESGFFEDSLKGLVTIRGEGFKAKDGGLGGRRVVVFLSGPGRMSAATAAETLIDGHKPALVLSAGFAGGLAPQFKRHDLFLPDEVLLESGESIAISPLVPTPERGNEEKREETSVSDLHRGKLLTADRIIRTIDEKKSLFEETRAAAVDMETFAVAEVCRRRSVPFAAVRIIHDPADQSLPPDIEKLLDQKTEAARFGAAIGALWKRPSSIKDLWALKENSLIAAKKLAEFLAKLAESL
jgi:adenosylhomocysteine nucleosidase